MPLSFCFKASLNLFILLRTRRITLFVFVHFSIHLLQYVVDRRNFFAAHQLPSYFNLPIQILYRLILSHSRKEIHGKFFFSLHVSLDCVFPIYRFPLRPTVRDSVFKVCGTRTPSIAINFSNLA